MNPDKQKSLDAMRTFARDVERERSETPTPQPVPPEPPVKTDTLAETKSKKEPHHSQKQHSTVIHDKVKSKTKDKPTKKVSSIPPFHELQKVVNKRVEEEKENRETKPIADRPKGITPKKPVAGGTVITDNKKARTPFFTSLKQSLQNWFTDVKKSLAPKKKNTYAVRPTERRKGVVQKATSKTGTIFSADNETLREQIKARQREKRHEQDDITWTPYTEPGFLLLEDEEESADPRVSKVSVTKKTHSSPKPVIKSTEKIPELRPEPEPLEVEERVDEVEEVEITPAPTHTQTETPKVKESSATVAPTVQEDVPEATEIIAESKPPLEENVPEESWTIDSVSLKDTNTLAMLLVGVLLGLGIIGFVLFAILDVGSTTDTTPEPPPEQALFMDATLKEILLVDRTFNSLVSSINSTIISEASDQTVEFTLINSRQEAVPPPVLMRLIKTQVSDGFADSITTVRFIRTAAGERAILLRSSDQTTARGGMLNWEETLLADVGLLLDTPDVPPNAGAFVDTQLGTLDVRALLFNETTLLVYALVNDTDVVIASDIAVLTDFAEN